MRGLAWTRTRFLLFFTLVFFSGCATIPSEAPGISAELGKRISLMEDANLTLLHRFFDLKRNEVDRFIQSEWVPTLAEEVFSDPKVTKAWDTIVAVNSPSERLKFLFVTLPKLQERTNAKRLELIQPLDDMERRIEQKLREEYMQARAMNNSISSFLLSASEVTENRSRYLEIAGVSDEKIGRVIDKVNDIVADLSHKGKDGQVTVDKPSEYLEKLRKLTDTLAENRED